MRCHVLLSVCALPTALAAQTVTPAAVPAGSPNDSSCSYHSCAFTIAPRWNGLAVKQGAGGATVANLHFFWPVDLTDALRGSDTTAAVDMFGVTHPGRVRRTNADHFLVASLHRTLRVHATSLNGGIGPEQSESRGILLLVADGVGGLAGAEEGSARVVSTVAQHLLNATELCSQIATTNENDATNNLRDA